MKVSFLLEDNSAQIILRPETATDKDKLRMFRGDGRQCLRIKHTAEPEALVIEAAEPDKPVMEPLPNLALRTEVNFDAMDRQTREYLERTNA